MRPTRTIRDLEQLPACAKLLEDMDGRASARRAAAVKPESFFVDEPPNRNIVCNRPFFELQKENQRKLYDPLTAESQYILLPDVRGNLSEFAEHGENGVLRHRAAVELYRQPGGVKPDVAVGEGCQATSTGFTMIRRRSTTNKAAVRALRHVDAKLLLPQAGEDDLALGDDAGGVLAGVAHERRLADSRVRREL